MKLKVLPVLLLFSFFTAGVNAQQKPYFTQYILNNYILNPAVTGIENYTDVKLSYRNQWAGIDGAPITTYFSIQGPIGKKDYKTTATSFAIPGENPRGKQYWQDYTASEPHHGLGMIVMNDHTGYINRFSLYGTYAYHKGLSARTTLSVGFLAGINNVSLDKSKIVWGSLDPNDPAIGIDNGEIKRLKPEVGAGLWLYSKDYFLGASVLNIVPGKANFGSTNYGNYFQPQFMLTAGYRTYLSDDVSLLPSVMGQFVQPYPVQLHFNVKLQYQDKVWVGASYRMSDQFGGYAAMAGLNVSSKFNISYAYDVSTTSRLRTYTQNTHELMIGFLLNNKYDDSCPRNNW